MDKLYSISSKQWVAGVEVNDKNIIVRTAPILKAWRGSHIDELIKHCALTNSTIEEINESVDCQN